MSQDIRRDREMGHASWNYAKMELGIDDGRLTHVSIPPEAERWQDIAYNENERAGHLKVALDAANAKLAEANDALEQARRDAAGESLRLRIENYLKVLEQNADEDAAAALICDPAIHAADSLFSQFQAANRARANRKVVRGLRELLTEGEAPDLLAAFIKPRRFMRAPEAPKMRYWRLGMGTIALRGPRLNGPLEYWCDSLGEGWRSYASPSYLCNPGVAYEITAAELPAGVTP